VQYISHFKIMQIKEVFKIYKLFNFYITQIKIQPSNSLKKLLQRNLQNFTMLQTKVFQISI